MSYAAPPSRVASVIGGMEIVALRIDAALVEPVFLVIFFNHEPSALGAGCSDRLKMRDKRALGIIRASVEFLSASLCLTSDYASVAAFYGTLCKRNALRVVALRES